MKPAFVIPWYGTDIPGGAEAECRRTAEELAKRGAEVEVLTTCLHSLGHDWSQNFHPPGREKINGVEVIRFPVAGRDEALFDRVNVRVSQGLSVPLGLERVLLDQMVNSPELEAHIAQATGRLFLPIPYLFSTTVRTAGLRPEVCVPIACLHDEPYAFLAPIQQALLGCRGVIFHTRAEADLAARIMDFPADRALLYGEGVETDISGEGDRFRRKFGLNAPFLLYAGRRDASKNTPLLLDYFARYKRSRDSNLKLALMGNQDFDRPPGLENEVIDLGFLSRADKADAYAAADVLCQPSVNESFSLVIMEAWLCGTPVMVHARCAATREHVERNGGGLIFDDYDEFSAGLDRLTADPELRATMADQGREYVLANFHWDPVCRRYLGLLEDAAAGQGIFAGPPGRDKKRRIHQFTAGTDRLDLSVREALALRDELEQRGTRGGIYAPDRNYNDRHLFRPLDHLAGHLGPNDIVIRHWSAGGDRPPNSPRPEAGQTVLRLHGWPDLHTERGPLTAAAEEADSVATDWPGPAVALGELGLEARARPPFIQTGPEPPQRAPRPELLYVGPFRPAAKLEQVVALFSMFRRLNPAARLTLAGLAIGHEAYLEGISRLISRLRLGGWISIVPPHPAEDLDRCFDRAGCLICLGRPLDGGGTIVRAMESDLPVAAAEPAGELLGGSGLIVDPDRPALAAEAIQALITDPELYRHVAAEQRERLAELTGRDLLGDLLGPETEPEGTAP